MSRSVDRQLGELAALGERNARIIELLTNHCGHARVEKSPHFGQGMAEAVSGLPIDGREIRCPHARNGSTAGMNLESVTVDFYRRNCAGCDHRDPVRLPNLKGLVDELDAEQARRVQAAARERTELERAREGRAARRREQVAGEADPTRRFISLLDGIDADEPDDRANQFLDIARAAPEVCTPAAAKVILETARAAPHPPLVEAIGHLQRDGRLLARDALEVALAALAQRPVAEAAELVAELREHVSPGAIKPAIPAILALAGPPQWIGERPTPHTAALAVAAAIDLPAVLDVLLAQVAAEDKYVRATGASAAESLLRVEPAAASVLVRPLVDALALPGSDEPYLGSPRGPLLGALRQALKADPAATSLTILNAGDRMSDDTREALVHVFDGIVSRFGEPVSDAAVIREAVQACIEIAGDRWGERAARSAADGLDRFARREPQALLPHAESLLGILMSAVAQPLPVDPVPGGMEWLARGAAEALRGGRLSKLRESIAELVKADPVTLRDPILAVIDADDPPGSDEALTLRRELVELLAAIGARPDDIPAVLPRLYSALLHEDAGVRAAGVKAWRELARMPGFQAPPELEDLLPALLTDPYLAVHRAMVAALQFGLPVPDRHLRQTLHALLQLGVYYAKEDGYFLDDVIGVAWRTSARFDPAVAGPVQRGLLELAKNLSSTWDLERLVTGPARDHRGPEMVERLVQLIGSEENPGDRRSDDVLRLLREQPADILSDRAQHVREAARRYLPLWNTNAAQLVEVLQCVGRNDLALELAEEVVGAIPETTEDAGRRLSALSVAAAAGAESALLAGRTDSARGLLARWKMHDETLADLRKQRVEPWDVDE